MTRTGSNRLMVTEGNRLAGIISLKDMMKFFSLFAFSFAVTIGTLWEIFEFSMDQLFGFNMQKPMMGDPSGLTDTMWDMIVNAIGLFPLFE